MKLHKTERLNNYINNFEEQPKKQKRTVICNGTVYLVPDSELNENGSVKMSFLRSIRELER